MAKGLDALHTALIFQQLDIADAILERLGELWRDSQCTVMDLKNLLTVRDSYTRTTTIMLMCRLLMLYHASWCLGGCLRVFTYVFSTLWRCRWGNEKLRDRVVELLKITNHQNVRFPEILQVIFFERDRSGLTVLDHAVRSGDKLVVSWCMRNGAVAYPYPYNYPPPESDVSSSTPHDLPGFSNSSNLQSLILEGLSKVTSATLWEYVLNIFVNCIVIL